MDGLDYIDETIEASASTPASTPATSESPATETPVVVLQPVNPVIERAKASTTFPPERLPASSVACTACPFATWARAGDTLRAHCGKMFLTTWESDEPEGIEDCSAKEEALQRLQ